MAQDEINGEETSQYEDKILFKDHFSLGSSTSTIRFRNNNVHIYGSPNDQIILEESATEPGVDDEGNKIKSKRVITVKRVIVQSFGLILLRLTYTMVAVLVFGFLFVFCFQIILFLFLNMLSSGRDSAYGFLLGSVFSIPIFVYGMASLMAIGWTFVIETWSGHRMLRSIGDFPLAFTEWVSFIVFLGIPALTAMISMFMQKPDWWEATATTWVLLVFIYMCVFGVAVISSEIIAYFRLTILYFSSDEDRENYDETHEVVPREAYTRLLLRAVHLRKRFIYSGTRRETYLVHGNDKMPANGFSSSDDFHPTRVTSSIYTRLTKLEFLNFLFDKLEIPTKIASFDEMQDIAPYVTKDTWSLELGFCRNRKAKMITVQKGAGALENSQLQSSMACLILGVTLILLILIALLVWMRAASPALVGIIVVLFILLCFVPIWSTAIPLYRSMFIGEDEEERTNSADNITTFSVTETVRITEPKRTVCLVLWGFDFVFLFLWPMISLFYSGNTPIGTVFIFLGTFSFLRLHFNISSLLSDLGSLHKINLYSNSSDAQNLRERARMADILRKTRGPYVNRWIYGYGIMFVLFMIVSSGIEPASDITTAYKIKGAKIVPGFYYEPRNTTNDVGNLPYQTCKLTKGFVFPGQETIDLQDFSFLATAAYMGPDEAQPVLDAWFGEGKVIDEWKFVEEYRKETNDLRGVSYKLFSYTDYPGHAVLSIRGSELMIDWLVNAQLWSASALAEMVRFVMPLGQMWNVVYPKLVEAVNRVESTVLREASYYTQTTDFVNDVLNGYGGGKFTSLRITGVSLGGGIAIITGAQTGASTLSISGPNAMMLRRTLSPPVTAAQLNTRVINVIPERDLIANIDDPGNLVQTIECRAPAYDLFGCHSMYRSLCEYAYKCGSGNRPILCWCTSKFGYPNPIQSGNQTWEEACADA